MRSIIGAITGEKVNTLKVLSKEGFIKRFNQEV